MIVVIAIGLAGGLVSLVHADPMDEVVQTMILESSEEAESLERVESALLKLGHTVVDSLVRLLASDDNTLRMTAIRVLGRMDRTTDEPLFLALRDDRWKVRVGAVNALAHHTSSDAIISHLLTLLDDAHLAVRSASARALGRHGSPKATDRLIATLQDSEWVVRKSVAKALGRIGDSRATAPLIEILRAEDSAVRRESMFALARIGHSAVHPLTTIVADKNNDPAFRQTAALVLREIALTDSVPSVVESAPALVVGLQDEDADVQQASADALVIIGQPAVGVVRTALLQDPKPRVRAEAATILGRSGSATTWYAEAVDALILALSDQDKGVRVAVRKALVRIHTIAFKQLVAALNDENALRRKGASMVLGELRHRGAIKPLEGLLTTEPDPAVRQSIAAALDLLREQPITTPPPLPPQAR